MPDRICVDASLVLTLLLPDDRTPSAEYRWQTWAEDDTDIVAPPLFFSEVISVLREGVHHRRISPDRGDGLFREFLELGVQTVTPDGLYDRVWRLAKPRNLARAYDAHYLAVADALGCELWTADRRLFGTVGVSWPRLVTP